MERWRALALMVLLAGVHERSNRELQNQNKGEVA